ncbi:hypothetical protein [Bradyrhizobium sp. USDA 3315]
MRSQLERWAVQSERSNDYPEVKAKVAALPPAWAPHALAGILSE